MLEDLIDLLESLPEGADFSDIGNAVGIILYDYQNPDILGLDRSDFHIGLKHVLRYEEAN